MVVLDRAKWKNSVRRKSVIENGELAQVVYLIPRQAMMEQLPFLNPDDYVLCEKMVGMRPDNMPFSKYRLSPTMLSCLTHYTLSVLHN